MKFFLRSLFILSLLTVQCKMDPKSFSIKVEKTILLKDIPSGSGMTYLNDSLYIISDDSPYLFQLDKKLEVVNKIQITDGFNQISRIEKPLKPDYESLAVYKDEERLLLYGFGSGSVVNRRDSLVIIDIGNEKTIKTYNLNSFYEKLGAIGGVESRDNLNIEGSIIHADILYLINRANNSIYAVNIESFNKYLRDEEHLSTLEIESFKLEMPTKEGLFIGLSGGSVIPGTDYLLLTATVEKTLNWIDDGEILGSYIGLLSLDELQNDPRPFIVPIEEMGKPLLDKIESITVFDKSEDSEISAFAIADNDDGTSKVFILEIEYE